MNAIDTNVLVRIIVQDNDIQSHKALKYVQRHREVFISHVVLCEAMWVFESCYDVKKPELLLILEEILSTKQFAMENADIVWRSLREYKKVNSDFADCLIGAIAHYHNTKAVGTFDKKAAKSSFFELIQ